MQWVAMISMFLDHFGKSWFPYDPIWQIVGRLAFPIYAYFIAVGMNRTRSIPGYIRRLAVLAVLSQIPFSLLFNTWTINVIGTFLVSVGALYLMERMPNHPVRYAWPAAAALLMELISFDYGAYGLLLIVIYRYMQGHAMLLTHLALNLAYMAWTGGVLQLFSLIPTVIFAYLTSSQRIEAYRVPSWLWRTFYPVHLAALYASLILLQR